MTLSYELRTHDELDGLGDPAPIQPRWAAYEWPEAKGLGKGTLGADEHRAAYRLDKNKNNEGWWALDDLIRVITGYDRKDASAGWHTVKAADLVKVMTVFRALGTEDRLEVCLPPAYREIVERYPANVDDQVRKSVELARQS
jgi:hypothetical protein